MKVFQGPGGLNAVVNLVRNCFFAEKIMLDSHSCLLATMRAEATSNLTVSARSAAPNCQNCQCFRGGPCAPSAARSASRRCPLGVQGSTTGCIVLEGATGQHGCQEVPAGNDLLGRWIVAQSVRGNRILADVHRLLCFDQLVAPVAHRVKFMGEQLKRITVGIGGRGDRSQSKAVCGLFAVVGNPCVSDAVSMLDGIPQCACPLPHLSQGLNSRLHESL